MDRYKEGYNDCDREWKKKIEEMIKELEKEYEKITKTSDFIIADTIQPKIQVLEDLLKKG